MAKKKELLLLNLCVNFISKLKKLVNDGIQNEGT